MRKILIFLIFIMAHSTFGQTINFIYAAPTANINTAFGAGNTFGFTVKDAHNNDVPVVNGYRFIIVQPSNLATFRANASTGIKKTYDSLTKNTSLVHRKLQKVLTLAQPNKLESINVFMINDVGGLPNDAGRYFCPSPRNGSLMAWPCANTWYYTPNSKHYGKVSFGEVAISSHGDFKEWEATLLHEFSHTQMLKNEDTTSANCGWGNGGCVSIAYGGDSGHWGEELQGDEQSPLDEGLATFWGLEHSPNTAATLEAFLVNNGNRFLLGSHSFLTGTSEMWNAPHNEVFTVTVPERNANGDRIISVPPWNPINLVSSYIQTGANYQLRSYKWLDVPGKFMYSNEFMIQGFFNIYYKKAFEKKDTSYNKILTVSRLLAYPSDHQRHRYTVRAAMWLAKEMENYANSTTGRAEGTAGTLVSSIFPLALYDMLAHFGMSDADLRREFAISNYSVSGVPTLAQPLAFESYMLKRAEIKRLLCPFLSNNADCRQANAPILLNDAVNALVTYCKDSSRILR